MRAIILSAGQGRRLLPLTADVPKCALQIGGRSLVEWQVTQLIKCGIDHVTVVVGFEADKVEHLLRSHYRPDQVQALYNPFFAVSDNLVSCWLARHLMTEDFILLNGDTLFEEAILDRLLGTVSRPITLVTDSKLTYDADDMKVKLGEHRVLRVGKTLEPDQSQGESIGMMLFRGKGPELFVGAIEGTIRKPQALKQWYLSVIDEMAQSDLVWNCSIQGLEWTEVDYPVDLEEAQKLVTSWSAPSSLKTPSARQFSEPTPSHSLYPHPTPLQETEASPLRSRGLTGARDERGPHQG